MGTKISALAENTAPTGRDYFPLVDQSSGNTQKVFLSKLGVLADDKTAAAALSLASDDAGMRIFVTSSDGGPFVVEYNSTPGTYADDSATYCGTKFIPSGGDGTIGIVRKKTLDGIHVREFGASPANSASVNVTCFQEAVNALITNGGGKLYLDDGDSTEYQHNAAISIGANDNISVIGGQAKMVATADCYTWEIGGQTSFATALTYYDITGSYSVGEMAVTLATASEASNFSVGDYVYMRCQQEVSGLTDQPVAELNVITDANATTGVLSLKWPMTKDFQDDASYPYGIAVANSIVSDGVKFIGGSYTNSYRRVFNAQHVLNFEITKTKQYGRGGSVTRGRFIKVHNNEIELSPDWSSPVWRPYIFAVDTGTSDAEFYKNVCRGSDTCIIHLHEGLGNINVHDNEVYLPETASGSAQLFPVVSVSGQSWGTKIRRNTFYNTPDNYTIRAAHNSLYSTGHRNIDISENKIYGTITAGTGPGTAISTGQYCDGKIHDNVVDATLGGYSIQTENGDVTVRNNDVPSGSSSLSSSLVASDVTGNKGILRLNEYVGVHDMTAIAGAPVITTFAGTRRHCYAFDPSSNETVSISQIRVPDNATSCVVDLYGTNIGADTGIVKWDLTYGGFAAGEDADVADSAKTISTTGAVSQDYIYKLSFSSFSVTGGDILFLRIGRDATNAADTLTNDAGLVSLDVKFSQ